MSEEQNVTFDFGDELEFQIIKNILVNRDFLVSVIEHTYPSFFENRTASICCSVIKSYFLKYSDVPSFDVLKLETREFLTPKDDIQLFDTQLDKIKDSEVTSDREYLLAKVLEFCRHRALTNFVYESIGHIKNKEYSKMEDGLKKAMQISEVSDSYLTYFDDAQKRLVSELKYKRRIRCGISMLDTIMSGGWSAEDTPLVIIIAPTGVGKSIFCCKFGSIAVLQGCNVLHISHELSEERTAARYDSLFTRVGQSERVEKYQEVAKKIELLKTMEGMGKLVIKEYPMRSCTAFKICALLDKLKLNDFVPDLIINDYLDVMSANNNAHNSDDYAAQKRISEELRALARVYKIPIITASQTNRGATDKDLIGNSDVAESFGKLFGSDMNITINQTKQERLTGECRLYVPKFRNGRSGDIVIPLKIDYDMMNVIEIAGLGQQQP